ncbi:MAG: metal-dependent hydrolase [Rhodospirillales bacterium]|nr:MAG: metal-dependent hydrolase [Rhodospirillales bacterium]
MFIAHLPAGYLLAHRLAPRLAMTRAQSRRLMAVCLLASVLPDIDLLYFHAIDGRRTLHHDYWTHIPVFWLIAAAAAVALFRIARMPVPWPAIAVLLCGIFLHLVLDTVTGGIAWLYPFGAGKFALIDVPARFDRWVWNFVLHWSFLLEITILAWAGREIGLPRFLQRLWRPVAAAMLRRRASRQERAE